MSQGLIDIDLCRIPQWDRGPRPVKTQVWRERRDFTLTGKGYGEVFAELKINGERILLPVLEIGAGGLRIGVNLTNLVSPTHVARDRFVDQEIGS